MYQIHASVLAPRNPAQKIEAIRREIIGYGGDYSWLRIGNSGTEHEPEGDPND